jgi:amino-acid N-acetyltransferase
MKSKKRVAATPGVRLRKARMGDIEAIYALVNGYGREGVMLPRSRAELYDALRDFLVADRGGELVEIKSLAVAREHQRRGIGRRLVRSCLAEARRLGITKVFALTTTPDFFAGIGFEPVSRETLPHKIWSDCVRCPKFPDCDEFAVAIDLAAK